MAAARERRAMLATARVLTAQPQQSAEIGDDGWLPYGVPCCAGAGSAGVKRTGAGVSSGAKRRVRGTAVRVVSVAREPPFQQKAAGRGEALVRFAAWERDAVSPAALLGAPYENQARASSVIFCHLLTTGRFVQTS